MEFRCSPFPVLHCGKTPPWSCSVFSLMTLLSWMIAQSGDKEDEEDPVKGAEEIRASLGLIFGETAGTQDIAEALGYNCRTLHLAQLEPLLGSIDAPGTEIDLAAAEAQEVGTCEAAADAIAAHLTLKNGGPVVVGGGLGGAGALVILGTRRAQEDPGTISSLVHEFLVHDPHCASPLDAASALAWLPLHRAICVREAWHNILLPFPAHEWNEGLLRLVNLADARAVAPETGNHATLIAQAAAVLQETFPKVNKEWWHRTLTDLKDDSRDTDLCLFLDLPKLLTRPVCVAYARLKRSKTSPAEGTLLSLAVPLAHRGRQFGRRMVRNGK